MTIMQHIRLLMANISLSAIISPFIVLVIFLNVVNATEQENNPGYILYKNKIEEMGYSTFEPLNIEELGETKGKAGPLIFGGIAAVGAAGTSIGLDYSNGRAVNWGNAASAAAGGFVAGATGGLIGGSVAGAAASAALGASASGATNALIGSISNGGSRGSCDTCHKRDKK